jgi:midasin (ATPase involved in ribosome maturation)
MVSAVNERRSIIQAGGMVHDIYRDSNIPEVLLAREPLEELSQRLLELLVEFDGNALLEQLLKITRRVLSFPITSPLMKVLTGLEFLHGKTNDWETNASKRVSLYAHMEKIGRLIGLAQPTFLSDLRLHRHVTQRPTVCPSLSRACPFGSLASSLLVSAVRFRRAGAFGNA